MPASSPERSGGGAGKWRKACNYVSEIWISTFETLIGKDDISNDLTWYVFITLQVSQGLASCKKFLVLFSGTWIRIPWAEFRISKLRIPVSMSKNFPDFPLIGAKVYYRFQCSCYCFSLNSVFYVWGPFTMRLIIYERQNKKTKCMLITHVRRYIRILRPACRDVLETIPERIEHIGLDLSRWGC